MPRDDNSPNEWSNVDSGGYYNPIADAMTAEVKNDPASTRYWPTGGKGPDSAYMPGKEFSGGGLKTSDGGGGSGGGGGGGGGGGSDNTKFDGFDISGLTLGMQDGHVYGQRRVISGDPNNPGMSKYGYETVDLGWSNDPAAVAAASGIPVGDLTTRIAEMRVQNKQTQANGYGHLIGQNPDGSYIYEDSQGVRKTTTAGQDLTSVGISPAEVAQAQAQRAETQRTLTQMGQFSVAGQNPDGSLQVRDYNGTLSTVTAAQAAAGQIPGVSYADFQRAQSDFINNQKAINSAGNYEATAANPDGSITIKDGLGKFYTVPAAEANGLPGIAPGQVQELQQQASDRNFLGAKVSAGGTYTPAQPGNTPWVTLPGSGAQPQGNDGSDGTQQGGTMAGTNTPVNFGNSNTAGGGGQQFLGGAQQGGGGGGQQFLGGAQQGGGGQRFFGGAAGGAQQGGVPPQGGGGGIGPGQQSGGGTDATRQGMPLSSYAPSASQQATYGTYGANSPAQQTYNGYGAAGGGGGQQFLGGAQGGGGGQRFLGGAQGGPAQQGGGGAGGQQFLGPPQGGGGGGGGGGFGYSANGFNGTQQDLQHGNQALQNYYQYGQNQFNVANQGLDQQNTAYRYNQLMTQDQNAGMSRNMGGMGWAGLGRPTVAGS
jgi:hypothetical protein